MVNGGKVGKKAYKATELVSTEGSTVVHDMPKVGFGHCNIKINESTILIAGLNWRTGYSETFFQNVVTGHFTPGPLFKPRLMGRPWVKPSCGMFNLENKPHAIVVGEKLVYALDLSDLEKGWKLNSKFRVELENEV